MEGTNSNNGIMNGKRGIIMGVANDRSIAWGIAAALAKQGAELAFPYQGDALEKRVRPLAESVGSNLIIPCDVSSDEAIDETFKILKGTWETIDFIVHAIAYSDKEELKGKYVDCSRENFLNSLDISAFSFTRLAKSAFPLMNSKGGSLLTLSYLGAQRTTPNYNVMGVAKSARAKFNFGLMDYGFPRIKFHLILNAKKICKLNI